MTTLKFMEPGFEKHAFHLHPNVSVFGADKETGMGRGFGFVTFGAKSCEFPREACLGKACQTNLLCNWKCHRTRNFLYCLFA
jgi:hypothetical protein